MQISYYCLPRHNQITRPQQIPTLPAQHLYNSGLKPINLKRVKQIEMMLDDNPFSSRTITCLLHRREKATHICTEFNCQQNSLLCSLCMNDSRWRTQHPHDISVRPLHDGIEWLTNAIKTQTKSIELIYERTIGSRECELTKFNLEKGVLLMQQLENRLQSLRQQFDLEMDSLVKQFQKDMQLQKQDFQRRLDDYKKLFTSNMDYVKRECFELLTFQNSLKHYSNTNSFTLKLVTETERRSQEWLQQQKRVLSKTTQILENASFTNSLMHTLTRVNKSNLMVLPFWKGEKRQAETERDLRNVIRSAMLGLMEVPELFELDKSKSNEYGNSNKYINYSISA